MDKRDRDALKRSMEICRAEEGRTRQLNAMLKDDGWWHAATFASMHCQCQALNLYPWQSPPCIADGYHSDPAAKKLLQQMLDLGISRYAPDPMAAIEQAKRETVK